jgi:serine phosphatase RsbU (regulator of sigma subunit)
VWFGGWDFGLIKLLDDTIQVINKENGLSSNSVTGIIEDNEGSIVISTLNGGINLIKNPNSEHFTIIPITTSNGLKDDVINGLVFNKKKNQLWIVTQKGLNILDYEKFLNKKEVALEFFGKQEGFINIEATNNHTLLCDTSGNIWIGTKYGITKSNPEIRIFNQKAPDVIITGLKMFFKDTCWLKFSDSTDNWTGMPYNLILKHNENHLTFSFIGINTTIPEKVRYKYRLIGADKDWSPETDKTEVTYSSLSPGEYTFQVKSKNNDDVWNQSPVTFSFFIKPPFWQTRWFIILCTLIVLLGFYLFVTLRTRKLKKDKEILELKVKERTYEIEMQKEEISTQRDDILVQKEELIQQKEEIETQRDEIIAQRDRVTEQMNLIAEQNREIKDSIIYAKKIQSAILPGKEILHEHLKEHIILFKPRDIVSGDFYWFAEVEKKLVIAAADCTGHGVPGAFMSMLGTAFLKEIVVNEYITHPGVILRKLRKEIVRSLQQQGEVGEQKDGMDIALICIDSNSLTCQFAGANNPLYVIRKQENKKLEENICLSEKNYDLYEFKGDKMPISIYLKMDKFTTCEFQLEKDDQLYLFSDGFADQFGGNKGKKFKYKPFKQLLLEIAEKPMPEQKEILDQTFEEWKGIYNQTDDVMIIGIKL